MSRQGTEQNLEKELRRKLHPQVLALREAMHRRLLEVLDLASIRPEDVEDKHFRAHVDKLVDELLDDFASRMPKSVIC